MKFFEKILLRIKNIPAVGKFVNKETINYLIFGVLTTIVSYVSFIAVILLSGLENGQDGYMIVLNTANIISWILAVSFAYITNKVFVFESKSFEFNVIIKESAAFAGARLFSLGCEIIWMNIVVGQFDMNESVAKILANVFVMIMNYFFSKFFIFGNKKNKEDEPVEKYGFFKRKFDENKFVWGSFVLAAMVMLAAYIFMGFFPMGEHVMLKVDMYHQYGPFHEEFRDRLINGRSLLYSWEGGIGKNFIAQMAYYTASPLSFLMVFFPQKNMTEAMALFVLLKVAFSASFFSYYLKKKFKRDDITIVIFGLMYASMAFITSYYWNVMWLDAVFLFPLVALGIEELVLNKKYKMYCISMALTILVNFYIAFLVCVFSALYFLVFAFSTYSWKKEKNIIINRFIHFSILSIIAGGISMILTMPAAVALSHTQASDSSFPAIRIYDCVYQLITNHLIGAKPVVLARNEDLPNVYSGLLTLMLIPAYYLNRKNIKTKEKVLYSLFLGFMLLCSCINTLDFLIHGLHFPSNLPHRFTFMYSFVLIAMAYKAFINIRAIDLKKYFIFLGVLAAIALCTEYLIEPYNKNVERVITNEDFIINAVVGAVYLAFILQIYKGRKKDIRPLAGIVIIVFAECIFSTATGIAHTGRTVREDYVGYIDGVERAVEYANNKDGNDFNRMEMHRFKTINEGALYHFKGYSQFSSLAYGNTSKLMENLGIAASSNSYRFYDPTPLFDSMFNLKYIVKRKNTKTDVLYNSEVKSFFNGTDEEEENLNKVKNALKEITGSDDLNLIKNLDENKRTQLEERVKNDTGVENLNDIKGIDPENEDDYVYLYENPYVLPLGFLTDPKLKDWATDNDNPFEVQNNFVSSATDVKEDILTEIPIDEISVNSVKEGGKDVDLIKFKKKNEEDKLVAVDYDEYMDYLNKGGDKNISEYRLTRAYNFKDNYKPVMSFKINAEKGGRVFLYVDAGYAKNAKYEINGRSEPGRDLSTGRSFIDIGYVEADTVISLDLELTRKGAYEKTYRENGTAKVYAAVFNEDVFKKAYDELKTNPMVISEYGDDFINGTINAEEDGFLYTSIPYDDGWTVKIDGSEAEKIPFGSDGLIGIDIPKGNHKIEFSYYPVGLNIGIFATIISLILFGVYIWFMEKKKKTS